MNQDLLNLLKQRRSIYALGKDVKQNPDDLVDLIETVIQETPTAFNSQTTRAVFLFGEQHDKLWDIVVKRLESEVPTEQAYEATKQKIASFKAAYGTIMYFTDTDVVKQLENDFPLYAANFATWAEQAQGSAQLNTWVTLANNGIGTNLQHYNPIIDDLVREAFDIPTNWNLRAQMPFGSIEGSAKDKDYMDRKDQFKVLK
ncbi:MAG: nitroreductase family protein [Lacticaseibacillus paracasei]|nr:nitroreductase family protein [Lacticaseibacillus paracasei]MCH4042130.1 nitroreductase family protein [Lacticaseibacillus paracasei]MCH4118173.1 nitroreductase family protein [Lacticaseibacillus paracasei]MCH4134834.1 nitroreductase family protein [Lacticaseibacillus paracasei]MCH4144638.1 nitroreductase family protein [Lacticaseibacillus paracasei]